MHKSQAQPTKNYIFLSPKLCYQVWTCMCMTYDKFRAFPLMCYLHIYVPRHWEANSKKICDIPTLNTGILHVPVGTVESKTLTRVLFLLVCIVFEDELQYLNPVLPTLRCFRINWNTEMKIHENYLLNFWFGRFDQSS